MYLLIIYLVGVALLLITAYAIMGISNNLLDLFAERGLSDRTKYSIVIPLHVVFSLAFGALFGWAIQEMFLRNHTITNIVPIISC